MQLNSMFQDLVSHACYLSATPPAETTNVIVHLHYALRTLRYASRPHIARSLPNTHAPA